MAIAIDQATIGTGSTSGSGTTQVLTTSQAVASGGFIVLLVAWYGSGITLSSVGGGSLTWAIDAQGKNATDSSAGIAIVSAQAPSGLASSTNITATFSGTVSARGVWGMSFTGVASSSALDVAGTIQTAGTQAWSTGTLAGVQDNGVVVAGSWRTSGGESNTITGPAVETHDFELATTDDACGGYKILTTGGSVSVAGTWTGSGTHSSIGAAYKVAAAGNTYTKTGLGTIGP